ncbi:hypothetical protein Tco_0435876 [Tanacetum coccineum]
MLSKFVNANTASSSGTGTLPSNTVTNPKEDLKERPSHLIWTKLRIHANYNHMTANRIDVIDMACEEYSQEVLGFSNVISSGNPTPYYDLLFLLSLTITPFRTIHSSPAEAILNSDPSPPPPNQGNYFPEMPKDLKIYEVNKTDDNILQLMIPLRSEHLLVQIVCRSVNLRCVHAKKPLTSLKACHNGPTRGTSTVQNLTAKRTVGEIMPLGRDKLDDATLSLEHKAYWAFKHANFDLKTAGDQRKVQLNELNKLHDQAYENSLIYKEKTKRIHDAKIKNRVFNVGDQVLLFNSRLKIFSGKLKSRWSGPFTIVQVFPYGTVELSQNSGPNFKVNGHRLKHYFGGDIPAMDIPDLQTFPKDN